MSLISGTENVVLSCPPLGALWRMYTSRFSSRLTSGFSRTPRTSVKMAMLAPMPSASVRITMAASPLLRISEWNATFRSRKNDMLLLLGISFFLSWPPSSRGILSPSPLACLHDFIHVPRWPNLENVAIRQSRMLANELYSMIHVPRLKDENAAELFFGFGIGAVGRCHLAVLPIQGQGGLRPLKRFSTGPVPARAKMVVIFKA